MYIIAAVNLTAFIIFFFKRAPMASLAPSFEVPPIPLGQALPLSGLEDLTLGLQDVEFSFTEDNWVLVGGSVLGSQ